MSFLAFFGDLKTWEYEMSEMNRRNLLQYTAAGLVAMPLYMSGASSAFAGAKTWPGLKNAVVINNLGGISNPNLWLKPKALKKDSDNPVSDERRRTLDPRALQDAHASGTTAVNVTIGYVAGPMDPFEHSVKEVASWNGLIKNHSDDLLKVESAADILRAKKEGKIGIIMGFQNSAMMGDNAERAGIFAGLGVKVIQLTYNVRNQIGDGSMVPENNGLTKFGHEVVEQLNASKTLIDLSHSGEQTCLDAIKASKGPISINHTGCRALANMPRNKSDQELRNLAEKGGMVGIYFMPFLKEDSFPNAMDVVHHIEHAINICGEDQVGIGTDGGTTGIDDMEAYRAVIVKEVERRVKAGIAAKGEKPGVVPFIPDLSGPTQFQKLADMLYSRGHSSGRIEKILGGNFLRLKRDVWGA